MTDTGFKNIVLQHFIGYSIGIALFLVLIPMLIWFFSTSNYPIFNLKILSSEIALIPISFVIGCIGVIFIIWSNIFLFFKGKGGPTNLGNVKFCPETRKLVVHGPYKYSRNPMALGVNLLYFALILFFNSLGLLFLHAIFFTFLVKFVVLKEEERLLRDFGEEYENYKKNTSMFIPKLL